MLTLALATAACGGGAGLTGPAHATAPARHPAAKPAPRPETGPVLSRHQLQAAVIDKGDLPGLWIEELGNGEDGTEGVGNGVTRPIVADLTDPAACAPVDGALYGAGRHTPVGSVRRTAEAGKGPATFSLVSYRHGDATRTLDDLRAALRVCTAFREKGVKDARLTGVRPADTPRVCDDTVSFRYTKVLTGSWRQGHADPVPPHHVPLRLHRRRVPRHDGGRRHRLPGGTRGFAARPGRDAEGGGRRLLATDRPAHPPQWLCALPAGCLTVRGRSFLPVGPI